MSDHYSLTSPVQASNPGQFENEMDLAWSRSQQVDSIYHMGRVGINTERPEEALSVHGNIRMTGQLLKQSDKRVKQDIEEVMICDNFFIIIWFVLTDDACLQYLHFTGEDQ